MNWLKIERMRPFDGGLMQINELISIYPIPVLQDNYVWALTTKGQQDALIVDPGEAAPVLDFLDQHALRLRGILVTHHHWDHTQGIADIVKRINTPVYGPLLEKITHLTHPLDTSLSCHLSFAIEGFLQSIEVLTVPGHTAHHVAYYFLGNLFCGDTLFASGCGRIFEGTPSQMFSSLQKIMALPEGTHIYCAHEYTLRNLYFAQIVEPDNPMITQRLQQVALKRQQGLCSLPSTLKEEKETNPFLRCHVAAVKASVEHYARRHFDNIVEVFAALRKWKDEF
jgi:hydroxyacylglutathione hydrolase